ncbi:hypothetical protein [Staphylococcus delphini]|uniref:hypothetical protein n=1 Tax=Staphylococcus delphini TaxID=53344 RepID=UPI0023B2111F|nr:hypothetical protein [Staphylococcus delphini]MDE9798691.1 hypothetical protein [Staphylococcus delphini]MDE9806677.1 hypothetical protein [Staphylococcus delphini]
MKRINGNDLVACIVEGKTEKIIRDFYKKYSLRDAIEKYHSYTKNSTTLYDLFV